MPKELIGVYGKVIGRKKGERFSGIYVSCGIEIMHTFKHMF